MESTTPSSLLEQRPTTRSARAPSAFQQPRVWGKSVGDLWASYLATYRIQVVTAGSNQSLDPGAEAFLLVDNQHLAHFDVARALEQFRRQESDLCWIRLSETELENYRERCVTDRAGRLMKIERVYQSPRSRRYRLALTRSVERAREWQEGRGAGDICRRWFRLDGEIKRTILRVKGSAHDLALDEDVTRFMLRLIRLWKNPSGVIAGVDEVRPGVWACDEHAVPLETRIVGDVWVGFDRSVDESDCIIGPAVLWDRRAVPGESGREGDKRINQSRASLGPRKLALPKRRRHLGRRPVYQFTKRVFDICFAVVALAITLPLYPLVMLAIYIEDGLPLFFGHRRETRGGKSFDCLKFRSMRKDAEEVRRRILAQNMCDGPQFFIDRDPRLTHVGRILRDLQVDEWPQFFHVLTGKMSVVGPRPLPEPENQYCPAWREARLSVRPGITGLWQIKRSRLPGLDFQEWIRYDIEYVENCSMGLDLWVIAQSVLMMFRLGWATLTGRRSRSVVAPTSAASSVPA